LSHWWGQEGHVRVLEEGVNYVGFGHLNSDVILAGHPREQQFVDAKKFSQFCSVVIIVTVIVHYYYY